MGTEDQTAIIDFLGVVIHPWRDDGRTNRHAFVHRVSGWRARLEAQARGSIRLPRFLDRGSPKGYSARPKCVSIDARHLPCIAAWWRSHERATGRSPWEVRESLLIGSSRWRASTRSLCSIDLPRAGD